MPGYGSRYWADRASRRRTYPALKASRAADVVVIGGGLTGCTAAYVLASAGMGVVLLEAERLAGGSTAGSLGAIVPEPDALYRDVERASGRRIARTAWKETSRSAREMAAALRKLGIASELTPVEFITNAAQPDIAATLRREQAMRKAAGIAAPWLTPASVHQTIGTESAGALRGSPAFTFNPVRAALGLAAAAADAGADIFEKSPVRRTRFTRKYAEVLLGGATIRTRGIFVATGEPGPILGQLRRHVRRLDGYAVATAPLTAAMRREMGIARAIVTEAGTDPHWWRWLPDGRVLFAGAPGRPVPARQRDKAIVQRTAQLMYELSVRYPAISGLPAAWGWDMPIVSTPDRLPWIGPHRNYPFHFLALAFGWHGDALAWLAAKSALRHFQGHPRREDEVFGFARHL
jgi:gamma-glutamylputrescine oxidase